MGFASFDDMISEITTQSKIVSWDFFKDSGTPQGAGTWHSLWGIAGAPAAGATPATTPGTAYTNGDGGMNFADTSPDTKHVVTLGYTSTVSTTLRLYDRLVAVSGLSLTSTGNKTVSSVALPRYTTGGNVEAWFELTSATSTTAPIVTMNSYTNQDGTTGRAGSAGFTFPASATAQWSMGRFPLQVGDSGVRAVSTINVTQASSSGAINLVLLQALATLPSAANIWNERDLVLQVSSLPRVFDGATLALQYLPLNTTAARFWGTLRVAYG